MSLMEHRADHCRSAQDVRAAARKTLERRKAWRPNPKPQQNPTARVHPFLLEIIKRAEFMPLEPTPEIELEPFETHPYQITIRDVQRTVARKFKIGMFDLLSDRRAPHLVLPRHVSFMLCSILTLSSSAAIGRQTGGRDHSTVLHANEKFAWLAIRLRAELKPTDFLSAWVNRAHELVTEGGK